MKQEIIKVDVVSDVACPWCYVGKRRLESAIKEWTGNPIHVEWHPFQLDPNLPKDGLDRNSYLLNKFGNLEGPLEMTERLKEVGIHEGIDFNFDENWLAINTFPLHCLLHVAGEEGFKDALKERFLNAYFTENLPLNKVEILNSIMQEFGWDINKVNDVLNNDNIAYAVKQEMAYYQKLGVNSVPFFIIENKYGISGAQPKEVFLEAFAEVSPKQVQNLNNSCNTATGNC